MSEQATKRKEHGMLFNERLVRAIADGSKTQTRRPVAKANSDASIPWVRLEFDDRKLPRGCAWSGVMPDYFRGGYLHVPAWPHPDDPPEFATPENWTRHRVTPKWEIGDLIWVRETWRFFGRERVGVEGGFEYREGTTRSFTDFDNPRFVWDQFKREWDLGRVNKWRPSIHMPRWAARFWLEITDVRCERVNEISGADAQREGFKWHSEGPPGAPGAVLDAPFELFAAEWNAIYPGSWDRNDFVWVLEFRRIERAS